MGNNYDSVTLHKYLYANVDPINIIDPSGNVGISSVLVTTGNLLTLYAVGQTSFDLTTMAIGGEELSAKNIGATILLGLVGNKILKPIAKLCKAKGSASKKCRYATGWTMAHTKMRALVWTTPNSKLERGALNRVIIVIGAFDVERGIGVAATNGDHKGASQKLRSHARKFGLGIGDEKACGTKNTVGRCAEWRSADKLLIGGSKVKNLRWTRSRFVDPGISGFAKLGGYTDPCGICDHVNFK